MRKPLLHSLGAATAALTALLAILALAIPQGAGAAEVAWQRSYDGHLRGGDAFTALAPAPGGVYAAGYTAASWRNRSDILLARYTADGVRSWVRTWNGSVSGSDQCWAMTRDRRGGLCLVGSTAGHGGDAVLLRYSASGRLVWSRRFDSGGGWRDDARGVRALSGSDAVYVTIESRSGSAFRTSVARYALSGTRLWVRRLDPGVRVSGTAVDARDDILLAGGAETASGSHAVIVSYAPDGSKRWDATVTGGDAFSRATSIVSLGDDLVWTLDSSTASGVPGSSSVIRSTGTPFAPVWETVTGVAVPHGLSAVSRAKDGGIVAVGTAHETDGDRGFALRLDESGSAQPPLFWSDPGGCRGELAAAAGDGSSWVAGRTGTTFSLLHLDAGSGPSWRYDYRDRASGRALVVSAAPDSGAYVAGWGRAMGAAADAVILRVSP